MGHIAEQVRRVIDNLPCGVVVASTSAEGEILLVNPEFTAITGYASTDVPTVSAWLRLAYPDAEYRAQVLGNWERDVSEPGRDVVYNVRCADGEDRALLLRAGLLGEDRMVVALLDLTEIGRVRRELGESENRLRLIASTVEQVFWIVGLEPERVEYANPAFERTWGRSLADLYEDPSLWQRCILDEDRPHVERAWQEVISRKTSTISFEYRIERPDGEVRWIADSGFAVLDDTGAVQSIVGAARDITDSKRAELERRKLEQQVQVAQKRESLGILAGGVAHDFNNLLVGILGHADLALADSAPGTPLRHGLEQIISAAHRAAELARQMLAYSGKGRFVISEVHLGPLIDDFRGLLETAIDKRAELRFDLAEDVPPIEADATQLRQILMNFVTNAGEAIGHRQGTITVSTGVTTACEEELGECYLGETRAPGQYLFLEVIDTGEGMDRETRERIFEPFYSTKFTGRGLGLAAVAGIVDGHGGAIKVVSNPGRGTTFRVLFPCVGGKGRDAPRGGAAARESGSARQRDAILLVDDDKTVRYVVSKMLERGGYEVIDAEDGPSAVELFREHRHRIGGVVLDLDLPGMTGAETLRALRRQDPRVPVLLSSGYDGREAAELDDGEGSTAFIQKPYAGPALLAALEDTLESREVRAVRRPGSSA